MTVLFGGPLSPLGWSVGFLRVPFAEARRATVEWRWLIASATVWSCETAVT